MNLTAFHKKYESLIFKINKTEIGKMFRFQRFSEFECPDFLGSTVFVLMLKTFLKTKSAVLGTIIHG